MRRRSEAEGFQHIAKPRLCNLRRDLQHFFENCLLHVRAMNTNRTAAQFPTIDHNIIMLPTDLFRIGLQEGNVLSHGRGEWMMARIPAIVFLVETQQREIDDPKKIKTIGGNGQLPLPAQNVRAIKTDLPEDFTR